MSRNIIVIGFMGAGKSLTAKELAKISRRRVISTDERVESRAGKTIAEIFAQEGEAAFRQLEREVVQEVVSVQDVIVDCGGGVVLNPANRADLKRSGRVFYLKANPEQILNNIQGQGGRPLLDTPNPLERIRTLYAQRESLYEGTADEVIDANEISPREMAQKIWTLFQERG